MGKFAMEDGLEAAGEEEGTRGQDLSRPMDVHLYLMEEEEVGMYICPYREREVSCRREKEGTAVVRGRD